MKMVRFSSFSLVATTVVLMAVTTASGCNVDKVCVKTISTSGQFNQDTETAGPVYIRAKHGVNMWPFFVTLHSPSAFPRGVVKCFDTFNSFSDMDAVIVKVGNDGWWPSFVRFCPRNRPNTFYDCQWVGRCGSPSSCLIKNKEVTITCTETTGIGCP